MRACRVLALLAAVLLAAVPGRAQTGAALTSGTRTSGALTEADGAAEGDVTTYAASARYATDEHFTLAGISLADDTAWTIATWAYMVSAGEVNTHGLWGNAFAAPNASRGQTSGDIHFFLYNDAGANAGWLGLVATYVDLWHHIVMVADGTDVNNIVLYYNGAAQAAKTLADSTQTIKMVMGLGSATLYQLDGHMPLLGVWDGRALSAPEVSALYGSGPDLQYADLTAAQKVSLVSWWDFEEGQGLQRNDSHGANHLTDVNTVGQAEVVYP